MLEVRDIHKTYEGQILLDGVSFGVRSGEIVCLLGESGSGKSTLLRIIAGLEPCEAGKVYWNGTDMSVIPPHKRGFGLMFQDYALFPHRTVAENVAFGLRMQNLPKEDIEAKTLEALRAIRMEAFADRPVTELSGGEQQRVALARALAPNPRLLMLDEPLGALDHSLRLQLMEELREVLHASHKPAIYVTHDREEAFAVADRLLILHQGVIVQEGTAKELYEQPANAWIAGFLGLGNLVPGVVNALEPLSVQTALGNLQANAHGQRFTIGDPCSLLLRPKDAMIESVSNGLDTLHGVVQDCVFMGDYYKLEVEAGGQKLSIYSGDPFPLGVGLGFHFLPEKVLCLPSQSQK
jgi:ABC-type Fe3+/spermidine/putrescine transport system ATPase subunit